MLVGLSSRSGSRLSRGLLMSVESWPVFTTQQLPSGGQSEEH